MCCAKTESIRIKSSQQIEYKIIRVKTKQQTVFEQFRLAFL